MWFLFLLLLSAGTELTLSNGNVNRLILRNEKKAPCEGYLEVYHSGRWLHVGNNMWNNSTDEVVCRSTHCGKRVSSNDFVWPYGIDVWLNDMACNGSEEQLWDCVNPGWGVSKFNKDTMKWIKCSDDVKIGLDGFQCEGLVNYSISGMQNRSGYFCADSFGTKEASFLCENLGCGVARNTANMEWDKSNNSDKMMLNCSGISNLTHLWQCATTVDLQQCKRRAWVSCIGHKKVKLSGNAENVCSGQLQILQDGTGDWSQVTNLDTNLANVYCKQMSCGTSASYSNFSDNGTELICTDKVTVTLMDGGKCYGAVHVTINGTTHPVCATTWSPENTEVVCNELGCGIRVAEESVRSGVTDGILDNVKCSGEESSLWHCPAKRQNKPLSCSSRAFVVCGDSVDVRLVDGPGKCCGRVEIRYKDKWQRVAEGQEGDFPNNVCRLLNCGSGKKTQGFSQGSNPFLPMAPACPPGVGHISECMKDMKASAPGGKALALTCTGHKVVFLTGGDSCSGTVRIEQGDKTYWLSGSNSTWNEESANAVCRQLNCGSASNYSSVPVQSAEEKNSVWNKSYSCKPNTTSLFKCGNLQPPPADHSDNTATVNCSGSIKVNLTNECWGTVIVCVGNKCGGVCKETWSNEKSDRLCQNLGCGTAMPQAKNPAEKREVIVKSLHTAGGNTNLNHSLVVMNDDKDTSCTLNPAYVVCSGSLKSDIDIRYGYKCSGNVKVNFEGQWLPVCKDALTGTEIQNTICEEMECGQHLTVMDYFGPPPADNHVISELSCPSTGSKTIKECSATAAKKDCPLGAIRCSGWKKMELKLDQSCRGAVFVYSEGKKSAVSSDGWTEKEGSVLCRDLHCGNFKSNWTKNANNPFWNNSFHCEGNPNNIWECEKSPLPGSSQQQQQQLFIECQGESQVTMSGECHGEVRISNVNVHGNGSKYANTVCKERGCRHAISSEVISAIDTEVFHINCEKFHDRLGQCSRYQGKSNEVLSVYCAANVEIKTKENCGGQILVKYGNKSKPVCSATLESQELLCQNCGGFLRNKSRSSKEGGIGMMLSCTQDHKDLRYCVNDSGCTSTYLEVYCKGYVKPPSPTSSPVRVVPIILGVGVLLVVVLLIVFFTRLCLVRRSKKPVNVALRPLPKLEEEFESDDYESVKHKRDEMTTFSHDRFISEAEVMAQGDVHSNASFPYDDIDEARPLASPEAAASTSGPVYAPTDETNYEVDEPQESYDDIDAAIPEVTQAEVHSTSQNTPENGAGLVVGGDGYLVPGQDD